MKLSKSFDRGSNPLTCAMNIENELDRIRGQGFMVTLGWGSYITFAKAETFFVVRALPDEKWQHCMYRSIMEFDTKYGV